MSTGTGFLRKAWSLQTHFLLFGALIVLPLVSLAGFLLYQVAERDRTQLEQRMVQIATSVAADLDRELQRRITILQTLATSPRLLQADFAGFHKQASAALQGDGTGIFLIDRSLQQLLNTYVPFGTALPTYAAAETAGKAFESNTPQISDFFTGRVTKRPAFDIDVPVVQNGAVQYVLAMGLEPAVLQQILRGLNLPPEWVISIADRAGKILAHSHEDGKYVGTTLTPEVSRQRSGMTSHAVTSGGQAVLRATARSMVSGWQVAVNFPTASAEAAMRTNLMLLSLWSILAVVVTIAGALWFARIVAQPIQAASQAAMDLAHDRTVNPIESHVIEANDLVLALHRASIDLSKAHRQQSLLLGELNHRVKNLLSIVILMTTRALSSNQLKEPREQLIQRFHSLARTHDLLIKSDWEGASLANVVESELGPFTGRVMARGPDLILNPNAAQTVTMILHELATNAGKYGALSGPSGHIELTWSLQQADEPRFELRWQESDGPAVKPPLRKGFGTNLLERSLPEASARISYDPEGVIYELEAPATALVAASCAQPDGLPRDVMRFESIPDAVEPVAATG